MKPVPCMWEYKPAYWTPGEAWVFSRGDWRRMNSSDVGHAGGVLSDADFAYMFPNLPPLPAEAFQSERTSDKSA
jgi:hypothetical protein